jgi:uncharacterized protein YjdB
MMKRAIATVVGSLALLSSFAFLQNCQFWGEMDNPLDKKGSYVHVANVDLTPATVDLEVGDTFQLAAAISPGDADDKAVAWTVLNSSVATVSASGLVTAAALGTTTVTATSADGAKTDTCAVKVMVKVPVDGVALSKKATAIAVGASEQLIPVITPLDAYNQGVTWTSSAETVATVSADGTVRALKLGTSTITVTTVDGGKTDSCLVTGIDPIHPTGVSVAPKTTTVKVGATQQLTTTVSPSDATNKSVTWSSNYPAIASVNSYGLVYGLSIGTAVITATTVDGSFTDTCAVTVPEIAVTGVSLNKTAAEILVGSTTQLTATVAPADATSKAVEWTSDKEAVATVSSAGLVSAHSVGTATITARTMSGGKTATCAVTTINPVPVTGVSLEKHNDLLQPGWSHQLVAILQPTGATTRGINWTSSNFNVVTVSSTGIITGMTIGTATITATTVDGGKTDECVVAVTEDATTTTLFFDDFESGLSNWSVSGSDWAIIDSTYRSSCHSVTESPDGNYPANSNSIMTLLKAIDISSTKHPVISFWQQLCVYTDKVTSSRHDYGYVDISTDKGLTWKNIMTFKGYSENTWSYFVLDLSEYKSEFFKVRFRLWSSNDNYTWEGWTIDDVEIREADSERTAFPFVDNFESDTTKWRLAEGNDWKLIDSDSRSSSHSISESPYGNYTPGSNSELLMKHPIDLSTTISPVLSFWYKMSIYYDNVDEYRWDYCYVQISQDDGINWTTLRQYRNVNSSTWANEVIDLSAYKASPVLIKFILNASRDTYVADGWTIDDISIGEN